MLKDGYLDKVYYRFWHCERNDAIANILAIHGLGGHCIWFDNVARILNKSGINFFSFDLPGFGQSKFPLGEIESYKTWIAITRTILENFLLDFHIKSPVFILGHSMGALIAILLSKAVKANGWILSVPGFEGHKDTFPLKSFVFPVLCKSLFRPKELIAMPFGPELLSKNKETQMKVKQDPLRVINVSAEMFKHVYFLSHAARNLAKSFEQPVFMLMAENDKVCSNSVMEEFFNDIKTSNKKKKIYKDSFHDLFIEDILPEIGNDIYSWIKEHI